MNGSFYLSIFITIDKKQYDIKALFRELSDHPSYLVVWEHI